MQRKTVDGKADSCLQQILMVCPRLAERLDTLMFKTYFMNVSSLAVISLCTSIIFYLISLIFFQIKPYSHSHYHLNARCSKPFRHICAECHTTAAFKAHGFCSRIHEYALGGLAPADTGRHSGKEYMACREGVHESWCEEHNGCPRNPAEQM